MRAKSLQRNLGDIYGQFSKLHNTHAFLSCWVRFLSNTIYQFLYKKLSFFGRSDKQALEYYSHSTLLGMNFAKKESKLCSICI